MRENFIGSVLCVLLSATALSASAEVLSEEKPYLRIAMGPRFRSVFLALLETMGIHSKQLTEMPVHIGIPMDFQPSGLPWILGGKGIFLLFVC